MADARTIRKLTTKLRIAKLRVRRLELLLRLAEREAASRCEHEWVRELPGGMRDNGEFWYICRRCGKVE